MQNIEETELNEELSSVTAREGYSCPSCGAPLIFDASSGMLACNYCGIKQEIESVAAGEHVEIDFYEYADQIEEINGQDTKVILCSGCGGESTLDENVKSTLCPYCSKPWIESDIHNVRLIQPSYLLPFRIENRDVRTHMSKWVNSLWWAPNKLKKEALASGNIQGIYLPCWTYDANTETAYVGQRGIRYTVTVGSGKNRRTETKVRWHYVSGEISLFFDDILISASQRIPLNLLDKLGMKGWEMSNLVEFDTSFMSGFSTEKYTVGLQDGYRNAQVVMGNKIDQAIRKDIGGDEQRINSKDTDISDVTFKLILLPLYISSYTFRNKLYHFYVNGRNGHVTGDRPYSYYKIAFAAFLALGIAGLILYYGDFF